MTPDINDPRVPWYARQRRLRAATPAERPAIEPVENGCPQCGKEMKPKRRGSARVPREFCSHACTRQNLIETVLRLRKEGYSPRAVAERVGRTRRYLQDVMREAGHPDVMTLWRKSSV